MSGEVWENVSEYACNFIVERYYCRYSLDTNYMLFACNMKPAVIPQSLEEYHVLSTRNFIAITESFSGLLNAESPQAKHGASRRHFRPCVCPLCAVSPRNDILSLLGLKNSP